MVAPWIRGREADPVAVAEEESAPITNSNQVLLEDENHETIWNSNDKKSELIVVAEELGLDPAGLTRSQIIELLRSK